MVSGTDAAGWSAGQRAHRLTKLQALRDRGVTGYPYRWPPDATAAGIRAAHPGLAPDVRTTDRVRIAGRVELIRRQGGLTFATLRDRTGTVQLYVDTSVLGRARHAEFDWRCWSCRRSPARCSRCCSSSPSWSAGVAPSRGEPRRLPCSRSATTGASCRAADVAGGVVPGGRRMARSDPLLTRVAEAL